MSGLIYRKRLATDPSPINDAAVSTPLSSEWASSRPAKQPKMEGGETQIPTAVKDSFWDSPSFTAQRQPSTSSSQPRAESPASSGQRQHCLLPASSSTGRRFGDSLYDSPPLINPISLPYHVAGDDDFFYRPPSVSVPGPGRLSNAGAKDSFYDSPMFGSGDRQRSSRLWQSKCQSGVVDSFYDSP